MRKINVFIIILALTSFLFACSTQLEKIDITLGREYTIKVDDELVLEVITTAGITEELIWTSDNPCVIVTQEGKIKGIFAGSAIVSVRAGNYLDSIKITVIYDHAAHKHEFVDGKCECGEIDPDYVPDINIHEHIACSKCGKCISDECIDELLKCKGHEEEPPVITSDPYVNMTKEEFYASYKEATSYMDAYYRTQHGFMSGSIDDQDQKPTISKYQPKIGDKYVRNTAALYTDDGKTYKILDSNGDVVDCVYKDGAYVTLKEVAAYIFAFGDIPANYSSSKKTKPTSSVWGEYLRVNHTKFSGDTSRYPYEPALPDISGNGGSLQYYEVDVGTTGTDCDPKYDAIIYNNGYSIERGAARIVYTRYDKNGNNIIDVNEKYLFYTYNHYNDFQEYLNYYGGWGQMFGNITGGGSISSKYDCNPTPYVEVERADFTTTNFNLSSADYSYDWLISNYYLFKDSYFI